MASKTPKQKAGKKLHDLFREVFELQAALSGIMDKVHLQAGLSTSRLKIIGSLNQIGPSTVPDIAASLGVSRQFVQTVCNDLFANGFLEYRENPRHKRSKLLVLTEPGRIAYRQARRNENKIIAKALPEIDPAKAEGARELLELIRKSVQKILNGNLHRTQKTGGKSALQ
jgi:DNA-binding MarR family transcriptional regulator